MIDDRMRRAVIDLLPPDRPSLAIAPRGEPLLAVAASLRRPGLAVRTADEPLDLQPPPDHVLVTGLDAHAQPHAWLCALRVAFPAARLLALIANGAYLPIFAAFATGGDFALAHPWVAAEIEPAFAAAGWTVDALDAARDGTVPPPVDGVLTSGTLLVTGVDDATFDRLRTAAYLVAAHAA